MKPLRPKDLIWLAWLLFSGVATYVSIDIGTQRVYSGQPALVWLHILLLAIAVGRFRLAF